MTQKTVPLSTASERLLQQLENLWNFMDSALSSRQFPAQNDLRLFILASVTAATFRIIRAIIRQIRGGSVDGIEILIRSLVEGMVNVKYILEDTTQMRARAYIADDLRDRLANVRRLIPLLAKGTARGMATVTDADRYRKLERQLQQERQDLKDQYGEKNLRFPSLEQRAKLSGTEELYSTAFWLFSLDTHFTARGLDRFMNTQNNNIVIELGQDLSRIYLSLRSTYIIFCALLNECSQYFNIPQREEFKKYDFIPQ